MHHSPLVSMLTDSDEEPFETPRKRAMVVPIVRNAKRRILTQSLTDSSDSNAEDTSPLTMKVLSKKEKNVLDLFAGSQGLQKAFSRRGFQVHSYDRKFNAAHDITSMAFFHELLQKISAGYYDYVHAGPPCSSFSQARWPKLRSFYCSFSFCVQFQIFIYMRNIVVHEVQGVAFGVAFIECKGEKGSCPPQLHHLEHHEVVEGSWTLQQTN